MFRLGALAVSEVCEKDCLFCTVYSSVETLWKRLKYWMMLFWKVVSEENKTYNNMQSNTRIEYNRAFCCEYSIVSHFHPEIFYQNKKIDFDEATINEFHILCTRYCIMQVTVRIPGELTSRACGGHHLRGSDPAFDCNLLSWNAAGVQTLPNVRRRGEQDSRGWGWSSEAHRAVLPHWDMLYRLVHLWTGRQIFRLSVQIRILQRCYEQHRLNRNHSLFHHTR